MKFVKRVALIAGEGGHAEQARRFASLVSRTGKAVPIIITEKSGADKAADCEIYRELNISKYSKYPGAGPKFLYSIKFICLFFRAPLLLLRNRPTGIVLFGPAFCVPFGIWARIFLLKVIYIETWSKFYSPTKTAKLMKHVAHRIYVQNKTMAQYINGSRYSGRL